MFPNRQSLTLEKPTQEKTSNSGRYNARNNSLKSEPTRDVQEQTNSATFKPFYGLLILCVHSMFNQLTSIIIKMLPYVDPCYLSLIRNIGIFWLILPIAIYCTDPIFGEKSDRLLLLLRGFFGATAHLFQVMAFKYLPLAEASIILSTFPIVTTVAARILLKETFGLAHSISLVMTVCGVLLGLRIPKMLQNKKNANFDSTYIAGLFAAFANVSLLALSCVYIRKLKRAHFSTILLYTGAIGIIESLVLNGVFISYVPLECGWDQILFISFGVFCFFANFFSIMAFRVEPAGLAAVQKSSLDILVIIILQAIFFNTYPDLYVICGACIVIVSLTILGITKWILLMPEKSK